MKRKYQIMNRVFLSSFFVLLLTGCFSSNNNTDSTKPDQNQAGQIKDEQSQQDDIQWIDYKNEVMGFSMSHPSKMDIREETETVVGFTWAGPDQKEGTEFYDGITIFISKKDYSTDKTLEEFANDLAKESVELSGEITKPVTLDNTFDYATYRYTNDLFGTHLNLIAPIELGSIFEISIFDTNGKYRDEAEKMLNSFKITDSGKMTTFKDGVIKVNSPQLLQTVSSPIKIEGEVIGNWFFEGDFNIVLTDWDGRVLGNAIATSTENWMTTDMIPFSAKLTYNNKEVNTYSRGTLIFKKSNPSDLPENDDSKEFMIYLK